ncbi:MAG: cupredoxin domain-containing protein [Nitrososphaera sp.]
MADAIIIPVALGLVIGVTFIVIFATIFPLPGVSHPRDIVVIVPVVIIPKGSSIESSEHSNFEPEVIKIVIGRNNTVRWVNQDTVPSRIVADNNDDPQFFNATGENGKSLLMTGDTFEFTFTKPGIIGYHSVPHPWKHGYVVVFPAGWGKGYFTPPMPEISQTEAVLAAEEYLRERVNNFHGVTLDPTPCAPAARYLNITEFLAKGCKLPLRYYLPTFTGFYSVDPTNGRITGECTDPFCLPFNQEARARLVGKLVYVLDAAWLYVGRDGNLNSLPDGFYVDAVSGEVSYSTFHCPEQKQEWCM